MNEQTQQISAEPRLVVGIGASAGGLDAIKRLLENMPGTSGMALVVVMHLDPTHESYVAELLSTGAAMPVVQATDEQPLEPNHVYVIAPDRVLEIDDGVLRSSAPTQPHGQRKPVNALFSSLATSLGPRAVGIILSGTGNDGSAGLRDIKAQGGLCLVQEPATAEYDGMPENAIATGVADSIVSPEQMPDILLGYAERSWDYLTAPDETEEQPQPEAYNRILELLGHTYGVNFRSAYKRGTLWRRAERRMHLEQLPDWQAYLELLQSKPTEVAALYRDVLVGVTEFFRDPEVWDYLADEVIPELLQAYDEAGPLPVKVWVPGCATGEEAYSFAIVFLEQIERTGRPIKLQVFATDVAEEALTTARRGQYPSIIQDKVSPERLAHYFRREQGGFRVGREVRDCVTFAAHNLLADPPLSRMDLVSCRNVLIYLESHAQQRVLELLHFALKPGGLLLLGASETIGRHGDLFEVVSKKMRLYKTTAQNAATRFHKLHWPTDRLPAHVPPVATPAPPKGPKVSRIIEQLVLSRYTWACVAVTESLEILSFFGPTHEYLTQPTGEVRMDLLAWVKPGLYPGLRAALDQAVQQNKRVEVNNLRVDRDGASHRVECVIEPVRPLPGEAPLFLVVFRERPQAPAIPLGESAESEEPLVRALEAELKQTRDELQSTVEQLESTNEEYRASHEELLSLNEELQSNNEELKASKEELQSLNEEMVTINRQLEEKNVELQSANADIYNLLTSTNIPIVFLDRNFRIRRFTPAATELMRLVPSDVGRSVEHIKKRFSDDGLLDDARKVLDKLVPIETEVRAEGGRWYARRTLPYRTQDDRIDGVCIAFHDISEQKHATRAINEAREYAEAIVATVRTALLVLDGELRVVSANNSFYRTFRASKQETEGMLIYELGNGQWNIPGLRELLETLLPARQEVADYEVEHEFEQIGHRVMLLNARLMRLDGRPELILLSIEDITASKAAQEAAQARADELAQEHRRKDEFLAMLGHELRSPLSALTHGLDLLALCPDDPARREHIHGMMMRQAKRIASLLDQLLDIARLAAGKIQIARAPVDLAEVAQAAIESVAPIIEARKHQLSVSTPPDQHVIVLGDFTRLIQVVENLLTNAAKYTEERGKIELSIEPVGDDVEIHVRDSGIGIDPGLLPHIFDLFTQEARSPDRSAGGLGLGLPLVRQLVEMHGGSVEACSTGRGQGSEFIVTLPAYAEGAQTEPRAGEAEAEALRVLVVDDEEDAATLLAEILRLRGHESRTAQDGPAALEIAREFHPNVVLLDLGLPKMDGYEVAERLREQQGDAHMLVVALTGYQAEPERLQAVGFDHHLIKPPDMQKLFGWLGERWGE